MGFMKARRIILLSLLLGSAYVAFVGCGDEETTSSPSNTDAGNDAPPPPPPQDSAVADAFVDARSPDNTGAACAAAADCYRTLDAAALQGGQAVCIDKVEDGYCTHECTKDEDCCAVPGECVSGLKQVCASFENSAVKYCFLSCEDTDIRNAADGGLTDAGVVDGGGFDGEEYCHTNASLEMGCRSTGGGMDNRKACIPTGTGDGGAGDGGKKDGGDAGDAGDAADQ
jgi:hypothetical protein